MTENALVVNDESLKRAKIAVLESKSVKEVAEILISEVEALPPTPKVPAVPAPMSLTPEFISALKKLPTVFGVVMPTERRTLAENEIASLYEERETLRQVLDLLKNRDAAISETIRHHIDVEAENEGMANEENIDAKGHYILCAPQQPYRVPIEGTDREWSSEYREGTVSVDTSLLEEMAESGEISREDYLSMTKEVRVFDEDKTMKSILAKPERLSIIRSITKKSGSGTSLTVRKVNKI